MEFFKELFSKGNRWTEEEKNILLQLLEENKLYKEISQQFAEEYGFYRSPEAIRKMAKQLKPITNKIILSETNELLEETDNKIEQTIKLIHKRKQEVFEMTSEKFEQLGKPNGKLFKILSLSDLHIPFENKDVIQHALDNHSDADILVLNGDFLDLFSVSKWPKDKGFLLRHEYELGIEWLKVFSKIFKKVVLVRGNHDNRLHSYFMSNLDSGVCFLTHPDPLERMANGYSFSPDGKLTKLYEFDNVIYKSGTCSWYVKIGDALFAHPSGGSKIHMKLATNTAEKFLPREEFSTLVIGHSHRMGHIFWNNKLLIEQGCTCVPMEYESDPKMKYGPQTFGYAVVYLNKDGKVDFNLSRPVYYGTGTTIKTEIRIGV